MAAVEYCSKHNEIVAQLHSMTGFAAASADLDSGLITLELRAVNSRFLDLSFRMGEDLRPLEPAIRERLNETIKRGKVECRVNFTPRQASQLPAAPNAALLAQLARLCAQVRQVIPDAAPPGATEILRWPGMLGDTAGQPEQLQAAALALLQDVIGEFNASRAQEGAKLARILLQRVAAMRELVTALRPRTAAIVAAFQEKITRRMQEILQSAEHERIHQEVALFAQKIDVDEELDRLATHLDEVERVIKQGGAAGKRLDFLMQELHREANTLGAKSVSLELTQTSLELKVLIEQMREQVQNLE